MPRQASGAQYLQLITALLQRAGATDATGGLWEAADLQWWWRRDQHDDPRRATFWFDSEGRPVAAVVFTNWGDRWGCDVIHLPGQQVVDAPTLWRHAVETFAQIDAMPIETSVRDHESDVIAFATAAEFAATDDAYVECWMTADRRPPVATLAAGYRLTSRAEIFDRPHHMIRRSGPLVEDRLRECSLYDPHLDLAIETDHGEIVAYGLFWPDLVTGVGLVEPMRTEDDHQGRGLARHLLTSGLDRLTQLGCQRLKISFLAVNEPARRAYLHSGFEPTSTSHTFLRAAENNNPSAGR